MFFFKIFTKVDAVLDNYYQYRRFKRYLKRSAKCRTYEEDFAWFLYSYVLINGYLARKYFDKEQRNLLGITSLLTVAILWFIDKYLPHKKVKKKKIKTIYSVSKYYLTKFRHSKTTKHIVFLGVIYVLYFYEKKTQTVPSSLENEKKNLNWRERFFIIIKKKSRNNKKKSRRNQRNFLDTFPNHNSSIKNSSFLYNFKCKMVL